MSRLILFDFDGTLVDSRQFLKQAALDYSAEHGLQKPDILAIQTRYMYPLTTDFGWGISHEEQLIHMGQFFDWYDHKTANEDYLVPIPYDGIIDALNTLSSNFSMGIVTSRPSFSTKSTLAHHNMAHFFKDIRSRCDQKSRGHNDKPSPDKINCIIDTLGYNKEHVIMVGDTCADIGAANNAGIKSIAVTWGYQDKEHLQEQHPSFIINSVADLVTTIDKSFS